jgi:threonine synthase
MLLTGGQPLLVAQDTLAEASWLAVARTGIPVDATGSSGLAGLIEMRRSGKIGDHDRVAVLFTGLRRNHDQAHLRRPPDRHGGRGRPALPPLP